MRRFVLAAAAILALALPGSAQTSTQPQVFTSHDMNQQLTGLVAKAKAAGISGTILGDYGTHIVQLSVRTKDGQVEIHAHYSDVMIVTEGHATLITGGTVVDPHPGANGETRGKSITGGKSQVVHVGDILQIPAGVPHQLLVPAGTTYTSIVIKVRQ
ncbi:hypothetical protein [Paracidobacterium acidisoli]|uniref:Cupin type-1 domain-containing protein n=1 Tax=Paracidobacterium acidisoli TaxID=2303751 RepID=A0A372IU43_9BACT|nr:hypothetical protein [Paracidobacterium acidisoli]MBT9329880.1 hypothetical protein [Paracidobacterium acidisoli]